MKVSINIPGAGQVYVSGAAEVVNRKALCRELGLCNVTFSRLESQHGFEYALNVMIAKQRLKGK
ncbi:hypothetical protein ACOTXN_00905 [Enterobacter cloacae complex sp. IR53043]|uniref:hypothetical protein n=1 Tax=Enterobacteriaceae TaxID=543 RepID=UPI000CFAA54C|nr:MULTISPECIES: hypothetical protein [Enterobacter cloacae complex]ELY4071798.1 hypothetical protein [Cronobacter sakazakii]HED2280617.1 hypothetical protein [Enterobacter hormaechei subsp. steigerwaltii]MBN9875039.1 hypothetical protein [Enterobacter hormaechei]MCM7718361.1 hypothetical protein [Enterobacter hormaechei]HED3379105.1 hypothetical protein [Enterobacter hormaechei subsp. steigerwaltii]